MNKFSLCRKPENVLVNYVTGKTGAQIEIDPDFRCVLRCLKVLEDPEKDDEQKIRLLVRWFFKNARVHDPLDLFLEFISMGDDESDEPAMMDFEQDADAIYQSFYEQYHIDLMKVEDMHWRVFALLLSGLGEKTALGRRIAIRDLDTSSLKGDDRIKADRLKRKFALHEKMSSEERALNDEINAALAAGKDPTEAIARLRALNGGEIDGG